jgi:putative ABC transport system permease protein/lipoprotein-releasing system permease protein
VLVESVVVVLFGWVAGVAIAFGLLNLTKRILMDPSAFALNVFDPVAYLYTVPAPIAILGVAWFTVQRTFRSFDPVGIVERRLV